MLPLLFVSVKIKYGNMIDIKRANKYCCEDVSLIENYEKAVTDKTQVWDCHHRKGTDYNLSADELIEMNLYWKRPASELIFLPHGEHMKLHNIGKTTWNKGKSSWNKGKHWSLEARIKMSKSKKGQIPWNKGKKISVEQTIKHCKHVCQIDKITGTIIKHWLSAKEASETLGINGSSIVGCCKGKRKSAGGFIWRYA